MFVIIIIIFCLSPATRITSSEGKELFYFLNFC